MLSGRGLGKAALAGLAALTLGGAAAWSSGVVDTPNAECPGRIVCPVSGEVICADRCPLDSAVEPVSLNPAAEPAQTPLCCAGPR